MCRARARFTAGLFILGVLLGGCSLLAPQTIGVVTAPPPGLPLSSEIPNVPYFAQTEHHCGPAALAMALNNAGASVTPSELAGQVFLPGRQGSLQVEMLAAARRNGMVAYVLAPRLGDVLMEINDGTPVITFENYGVDVFPLWHYAVAIGFDLDSGNLIRHSGAVARKHTPLSLFERYWRAEGSWAMVATPPDRVPVTATESRYGEAVIALEKTGQTQRAAIAYDALLQRWPNSLVGLMGRGNTAYALGDLTQAEAFFRRATISHPNAAATHNNLAQTLLDLGRLNEARVSAERAVSLGGPLQTRAAATLEAIRKQQSSIEK